MDLVKRMLLKRLISSTHNGNACSVYKLTEDGDSICSNGGWIEYLDKKEHAARISSQKMIYESRLAKWQAKTFWPLFIIAVSGGIAGIVSLIWQILDKN